MKRIPLRKQTSIRFIYTSFTILFLLLSTRLHVPAVEPVYPGKEWARLTPKAAGLDTRQLDALRDFAGGIGCVVRHGYMVYTWGDPTKQIDVASAVKPWYTHFLLKAIEDGKLSSVDDPIIQFEPRLSPLNEQLRWKDRAITWRHLSNQISCYGVSEKPGEAYDYSDYNMALFFDTLFLNVYGSSWERVDEEILHPLLTDPLQCQDNPTFMAFGTENRPGRLRISVRDFARFGLLYLREGQWRDTRLLRSESARMAVTSPLPNSIPRTKGEKADMIQDQRSIGGGNNQTDHYGSYSFAWWLNGIDREYKRHWPDAPTNTFGCFGHGGKRAMVVMPDQDLIVCWNDTQIDSREKENEALKRLRNSVLPTGPMTGQIIPDPQRPQWLKRHNTGPFFLCGPGDPEGFLYRGTLNADGTRNGDQMDLINKMKWTGANCLYIMAVRSHGGDGDKTENPFIGHNPAKGINDLIFDQWETWFHAMDENGITIFLILYDDNCSIWDTGDTMGGMESRFIERLVNRFEHHKNLIWCIAEEYQEALSVQRVKAIAAKIRETDDFDHPIAVHKLNGLDFSELADDPNIDQFAIQYNVSSAEELHQGMVKAWNGAKGRYNINMSEAADHGTGAELRLKNWACAMGGAYVMVLRMDIASTPRADLIGCGRLVKFFESTPFSNMAPHDELVAVETQYLLADPGNSYIAYAPNLSGKIGIKEMKGGTYDFLWFNCKTGKVIKQTNVSIEAGEGRWNPPAEIGTEIAVYIQRFE